MRRLLFALGVGIALAAGLTGFVRQRAPLAPVVSVLGIQKRGPFNDHCAWFVAEARIGKWPTGEVNCTWYFRATRERLIERSAVRYHVVSRRVRSAERSWEPGTDTAWQREADSIRVALTARGGRSIHLQPHHLNDGEELECWQFPSYEVQMHTGRVSQQPIRGLADSNWFLFLYAAPGVVFRCDSALASLSNDR